MSPSLISDLDAQLHGARLERMAQHIGIQPSQASAAVSAALPLLLGALGRNACQPRGAQALYGALCKDHAGREIDSALGSGLGDRGQGGQILSHIFGGRQPRAEQGLGRITGIGDDKARAMLRLLAPIVMAHLAKRTLDADPEAEAEADADALPAPSLAGPQRLGKVLGQEQHRVGHRTSPGGKLLGAAFDQGIYSTLRRETAAKVSSGYLGGRR